MFSVSKKLVSAAFFVIIIGMLFVTAYAKNYSGAAVAVINTNYSSDSLSYINAESKDSAEQYDTEAEYEVYRIRTDEDGNVLTQINADILEPEIAEIIPESEETADKDTKKTTEKYHLNDVMTFGSYKTTSNPSGTPTEVKCVYIGEHCVIWRATGDNPDITLNKTQAKQIADFFDSKFESEIDAFGDFYDVDGDGKVSIFCYDIGRNYGKSIGTYTAGYFSSGDMADSTGRVGFVRFTDSSGFGMDCIHIDTYPGMSSSAGRYLDDIEDCYSTLIHEFQHLINFSNNVKDRYCGTMEKYLNEAFSMAAEHVVYGPYEGVESRIQYLNSSYYDMGQSLTYFYNDNPQVLTQYVNSYLFGQYIRVRYGRIKGNDGSTIYKDIQNQRNEKIRKKLVTSDTINSMEIVAEMLNTTPTQLIMDFWKSVFTNGTGEFGFHNDPYDESWSDNIHLKNNSYILDTANNTSFEVGNGGAVFALMNSDGSQGTYSFNDTENIRIETFGNDGDNEWSFGDDDGEPLPELMVTSYNTVSQYSSYYGDFGDVLDIYVDSSVSGKIQYGYYLSKPSLSYFESASKGNVTTVLRKNNNFQVGLRSVSDDANVMYLCYRAVKSDGTYGELKYLKFTKNVTVKSAEGGNVSTHGFASNTDITLTVNPDDGYMLKYLILDGENEIKGDTFHINSKVTVKPVFEKIYGTDSSDISGRIKNVFWRILENGTLFIYGDGDLPNYGSAEETPWYEYESGTDIKSVEIMSRVKYIGSYALSGLENVTTMTIGSSVTEIGENCINENPKLTEILFLDDMPYMIGCGIQTALADDKAINVYYLDNTLGWLSCNWKSLSDGEITVSNKSVYDYVGDVNGDNRKNIVDVLVARMGIINSYFYSDRAKLFADVNCDGKIDILDVHKMREYAAKIITTYKPEE